jgi:hypothetical protein
VVIEIPALAAGVWVLARLGVGDRDVAFMRILRLTTVFAGIAAVLTAGGIGRLAAYASIEKHGGRRRAMWVGARAHAAASAGLIMIAAIPHGSLPVTQLGWLALPAMGAIVGVACGAIIGAVCGAATPVRVGDVMAAVIKRPSEALRQLLDPEDLLKLGAAVRDRTVHMFEGIFEPAERRPEDKPGKPPGDRAAESKPQPPPPRE